jgi:hypothetical protein
MKTKESSTSKPISWLDQNLLAILAGFLIIFIPLYPKIPLAELIPGYIVRLRLEDFLILFTFLIWVIQLIRRKANWHPLLTKLIVAYLIIGLLSSLSAIFVTRTIPMSDIHIGKVFLHWFRRIEYFSLFFIFYSAVKTKTQAKAIILSLIPVTLLVSIYGYGQKYLYWPVYSTMNREFSKGVKLYLTEHARVPSTFGGHYDAAAWIMAVITILLAIFLLAKNIWIKLSSLVAFLAGFWLLILTASRTSFIAYLGSVTVLLFLLGIIKSFKWAIPRWVGVIFFSMAIMLSFGDLSERYSQVLGLDKIKNQYYAALFNPKVEKPDSMDENNLLTPTDQNPVTEKPQGLPGDVYEDIPDEIWIASTSGLLEKKLVSRTFSDNAYKYGLSAAIRMDALWPRAIAGFKSNPLLGSGYSTLTKESLGQFTEAESTDNDYLRNLGETGLLGFLLFFATIFAVAVISLKNAKKLSDPLFTAYAVGFSAATAGLLLNAIYIDVFIASKVAEVYWALAGVALILPFVVNMPELSPELTSTVKASTKSSTKKANKSVSKQTKK